MATNLSMAERHAFGLERLAEMSGKLVEVAYHRALNPPDDGPEAQERAMLLFDRLARGFRMTLALEARMDRDRRRDAAGLTVQPTALSASAQALPKPVVGPRPARPAQETEDEREADLQPAGLAAHIDGLRTLVTDNADLLDPDGTHAAALEYWSAGQVGAATDPAPRHKPSAPPGPGPGPGPGRPKRRAAATGQPWRASG